MASICCPQAVCDGEPGEGASFDSVVLEVRVPLTLVAQIFVRWDIATDGGIDGRLPCLHVPFDGEELKTETATGDADGEGELLAARMIPGWVDGRLGEINELEGFRDADAKDESRAWVALLEGGVHAALVSISRCFLLQYYFSAIYLETS